MMLIITIFSDNLNITNFAFKHKILNIAIFHVSLSILFQVLHEELTETLAKVTLTSSEAEVEEACELVWQARNDNRVWKAGLDTSYKTFLANKPSPTVKAVLLSIL